MRFSKLFGKTLREAPWHITRTAEQLAVRAALTRRHLAGVAFLPIGYKALNRIEELIAEALQELGGQKAALYFQTDTLDAYKPDIASYRDLPRLVYWSDYPTEFGGLCMRSAADVETGYREIYEALVQAMQRCGLSLSAVEAGRSATCFVVPHSQGDYKLLICTSNNCGYCSTATWAEFKIPEGLHGEALPLTKIKTPHVPTIAALAEFLKIETRQTIKAVLYVTERNEFIFVVIRGDLDVNEVKLGEILGPSSARPANVRRPAILRPATEAEIEAIGAVPGYASPTGLRVAANEKERGKGKVTVVADHSIEVGANFVAGANEVGYHFTNINYPRDFQVTMMADIAQAEIGSACPHCGEPLRGETAFFLGSYSNGGASELTYLSNSGRPEPVCLDYIYLEPDEILLSVIDQHHDEAGIVWPKAIAPYDVHLIRLGKGPEPLEVADRIYAELEAAGKTVLYDDRDEASPGVKFADADLIGLPVRVTVSDKGLKAGTVEVKRRESAEKVTVAVGDAVAVVRGM